MKSGAEIKDQTYVQGFSVMYFQVCPFCSSTEGTNDHHCPGSDRVVDHLRNVLDDKRMKNGEPPAKWCDHDNPTKRRKAYAAAKKAQG